MKFCEDKYYKNFDLPTKHLEQKLNIEIKICKAFYKKKFNFFTTICMSKPLEAYSKVNLLVLQDELCF